MSRLEVVVGVGCWTLLAALGAILLWLRLHKPAPESAAEDTVPIPLPGPDPVQHAATTPTVSACLCATPCGARPCETYTKEYAYR